MARSKVLLDTVGRHFKYCTAWRSHRASRGSPATLAASHNMLRLPTLLKGTSAFSVKRLKSIFHTFFSAQIFSQTHLSSAALFKVTTSFMNYWDGAGKKKHIEGWAYHRAELLPLSMIFFPPVFILSSVLCGACTVAQCVAALFYCIVAIMFSFMSLCND